MPADVAFIGIDLGTSSVKLTAVGEGGSVLGRSSRTYGLSSPRPGWREIDPELWWRETAAATRELLQSIEGCEVRGIGVTGQMHTVVPVGAGCIPSHSALMWNDVRTADMVGPARDALVAAGALDAAATVSTGSPALNLCWLRDNDPRAFERTESFVIGPDWVVLKLTGSLGTDYCEASTSSLFDFSSRTWSKAALGALDLPERILPGIRGACEIAGRVTDEASRATGLPAGVPVVVGTGDNPAAAIPTGCVTEGVTVISLGTSGVIMGLRSDSCLGGKGKRIAFSLDGRSFVTLVQGVVQSCCSTRDWLLRDVLHVTYAEAEAVLATCPDKTSDLLFFPHMNGEKTLFGDPTLRGSFMGLSLDTAPVDLDRALLEGIGYGFRQLSDEMGLSADRSPVRVVGGGARSDAWLQTLADVLNRPLQRMEGETGAGYGAAILASMAAADGGEGIQASSAVRIGATFEPRGEASRRHDENYHRYLRMHEAIAETYRG